MQIPGQDMIPPKLRVRSYPGRATQPLHLGLDGRSCSRRIRPSSSICRTCTSRVGRESRPTCTMTPTICSSSTTSAILPTSRSCTRRRSADRRSMRMSPRPKPSSVSSEAFESSAGTATAMCRPSIGRSFGKRRQGRPPQHCDDAGPGHLHDGDVVRAGRAGWRSGRHSLRRGIPQLVSS